MQRRACPIGREGEQSPRSLPRLKQSHEEACAESPHGREDGLDFHWPRRSPVIAVPPRHQLESATKQTRSNVHRSFCRTTLGQQVLELRSKASSPSPAGPSGLERLEKRAAEKICKVIGIEALPTNYHRSFERVKPGMWCARMRPSNSKQTTPWLTMEPVNVTVCVIVSTWSCLGDHPGCCAAGRGFNGDGFASDFRSRLCQSRHPGAGARSRR